MRLRSLLVLLVLLVVLASPAVTLADQTSAAGTPVVHAVMFWMKGCSHCENAIKNVLPPIVQKYGDEFDLRFIELSTQQSIDQFSKAVSAMGVDPNNAGVPFLILGTHFMMGDAQVQSELPGLIDQYLASGGVDFAKIAGLESLPPAGGLPATSGQTVQTAQQTTAAQPAAATASANTGLKLGAVVMGLLVAALVYAILGIILRLQQRVLPAGPLWLRYAVPFLSVIGLFAALYLSYVELTRTTAFCGPVGDCNAVQSSPYARLFGILPVGVLGAFGYIAILVVWLWGNLQQQNNLTVYAPLAVTGLVLFGVVFSIYLTYLELFVIDAVCAWCLSSAIIMALLLILTIGPATRVGVEVE